MPGYSRVPQLAELLPGTWTLRATTFRFWRSRRHLAPTFTYRPIGDSPLRLHDDIAYVSRAGVGRRIVGSDRYRARRDDFVWRGSGILFPLTSVWRLSGINAEGTVAVLRVARTLLVPSGVNVIARRAGDILELEEQVRRDGDVFGMTSAELDSLVWLPRPPRPNPIAKTRE